MPNEFHNGGKDYNSDSIKDLIKFYKEESERKLPETTRLNISVDVVFDGKVNPYLIRAKINEYLCGLWLESDVGNEYGYKKIKHICVDVEEIKPTPKRRLVPMNIYAKPGTKVVFSNPKNGYSHNVEKAVKHLTVGSEYTVHHTEVYSGHTNVFLCEFPEKGLWFNSCHFSEYEEDESI